MSRIIIITKMLEIYLMRMRVINAWRGDREHRQLMIGWDKAGEEESLLVVQVGVDFVQAQGRQAKLEPALPEHKVGEESYDRVHDCCHDIICSISVISVLWRDK